MSDPPKGPPKAAPEPVTGAMPLPNVKPPTAPARKSAPEPITAMQPAHAFDDAPTAPRPTFVPPEAARADEDDVKTSVVPAFAASGGDVGFEDPTRDVSLGLDADPMRIILDDERATSAMPMVQPPPPAPPPSAPPPSAPPSSAPWASFAPPTRAPMPDVHTAAVLDGDILEAAASASGTAQPDKTETWVAPPGTAPTPARPAAAVTGFGPAPKTKPSASEIVGAQPKIMGPLDPELKRPDVSPPRGSSGPHPRADGPAKESSGSRARPDALQPQKPRPLSKAPLIAAGIGIALLVVAGGVAIGKRVIAAQHEDPLAGSVDVWGGDLGYAGILTYAQKVADAVTPHLDGAGKVTVQVSKDARPAAFAVPGKRVVLSAGTLRRLRTEAQLAALVAHLVAHAARGDVDAQFAGVEPHVAVMRPFDAKREAALHEKVARALEAAGYDARAYADTYERLGKKSGEPAPYLALHVFTADDAKDVRAFPAGKNARVGQVDYELSVLDKIGRSASR